MLKDILDKYSANSFGNTVYYNLLSASFCSTNYASSDEDEDEDSTESSDLDAASSKDKKQQKEQEQQQKEQERQELISSLIDENYRWYIVNVYAGTEDSIKLNLWDRIKRFKHESFFKNIVIPKITVEKVLAKGGKKKVEKTSFPGYMFVQMIINDETFATVVGTPRVQSFLGNHRHPKPMTDKDVLHFLGGGSEKDAGEVVDDGSDSASQFSFAKNQAIKVIDGPFANFDGVVDEIKPDQMKLKVLVSILGRETPVELSYDQVEKV